MIETNLNNSYSCYYFRRVGKTKKLIANSNSACWAGMSKSRCWEYEEGISREGTLPSTTYINYTRSKQVMSSKTIEKLVFILSKITDCKIVNLGGKSYIRYKFIKEHNYAANLLLLNFIRTIWYKPDVFNYEQFCKDLYKFEVDSTDPLLFLTTILRDNVFTERPSYTSYGNHSNVYKEIIPKTVQNLLQETHMYTVREFLKQPI